MSKRTLRDYISAAFLARDKASVAQIMKDAEEDPNIAHAEPDGDEGKHASNVHVHIEHKSGEKGENGNGDNGGTKKVVLAKEDDDGDQTSDSKLADRVSKLEDGMTKIGDRLTKVLDKLGVRDDDLPPQFKKKDGDGEDDGGEEAENNTEDGELGGDLMGMGNANENSGLTMNKPPSSNAELVEADPALAQEKTRMGDAAFRSRTLQVIGGIVRDTVARAEIMAPGIKIGTLDAGGVDAWDKTQPRLHALRRNALVALAKTDKGKEVIGAYAASVGTMSYDATRIIFVDASTKMRALNNASNTPSPMFGDMATDMRAHRGKQSEIIRGINDANRDYWSKQGVGRRVA